MNNNLVCQKQWDDGYKDTKIKIAKVNHPLRKLIEKHFSKIKGEVFEVGCFPGTFLSVFGELGYILSGVDRTIRMSEMEKDFLEKKYHIGNIYNGDFFTLPIETKYNIVCSFGFIEHFHNFEEVILKHTQLVGPSGYVFITVPNFKGFFQKIAHQLVDSENIQKHNLKSMDPMIWKKVVEDEGFEVEYCGWFGKYDFWIEYQERNLIEKILAKIILAISILLRRTVFFNSKSLSPFCGIIAKRI